MTAPKRKPRSAELIAQGAIEHDTRWTDVAEQIRAYAAEAVARERAEWLAVWTGGTNEEWEAKLAQARGTVKRGGKR